MSSSLVAARSAIAVLNKAVCKDLVNPAKKGSTSTVEAVGKELGGSVGLSGSAGFSSSGADSSAAASMLLAKDCHCSETKNQKECLLFLLLFGL